MKSFFSMWLALVATTTALGKGWWGCADSSKGPYNDADINRQPQITSRIPPQETSWVVNPNAKGGTEVKHNSRDTYVGVRRVWTDHGYVTITNIVTVEVKSKTLIPRVQNAPNYTLDTKYSPKAGYVEGNPVPPGASVVIKAIKGKK